MDVQSQAAALIEQLASDCEQRKPIGSMSVSIYDTAWVSMVSKTVGDATSWLFPEAFQQLLDVQDPSGGWGKKSSVIDEILSTMAGLLALLWHQKNRSIQGCTTPNDVETRIHSATHSLEQSLAGWDPKSCDRVGFEIIVPALLDLLKTENVSFDFPGQTALRTLNEAKMARFDINVLYKKPAIQTTIVHSLEALVGRVDLNRVRHHTVKGSMMASPSATAAYLIFGSDWDNEAEAYLSQVIAHYRDKAVRGVPSAFPITIFELSWVLSTLLEAQFTISSLGSDNVVKIVDFLEEILILQNGKVGFAPDLPPDSDDTAKTILCLSLLQRKVSPDGLLASFYNGKSFQTYEAERNASFSANCNILAALIHLENASQYVDHISHAVDYLCDAWFRGEAEDKWNTSPIYAMMLLSQAFICLLHEWDRSRLTFAVSDHDRNRVPIILIQILTSIVQTQEEDGSWAQGSCEVTAYAMLALTNLWLAPWSSSLGSKIAMSVQKAEGFLTRHSTHWEVPSYVWVEKITYSSPVLSKAYCMAALHSASSSRSLRWSDKMQEFLGDSSRKVQKISAFFSSLPLFNQEPQWRLMASVYEGYLHVPKMRCADLAIFPKTAKADHKYLEYIPITWTGSNARRGVQLETTVVWDMILTSLLVFQVDEYMETMVSKQPDDALSDLRLFIDGICKRHSEHETKITSKKRPATETGCNGIKKPRLEGSLDNLGGEPIHSLIKIEQTLANFIEYFTSHPKVLQSPSSVQCHLRDELGKFLHAHIDQIQDSRRFTSSKILSFQVPRSSYYEWVHTTSANHTSCPFAFVFFSSLLSRPGEECFRTARQKYLAQDLCQHLATMCRQYNDVGSLARDIDEGNLNSVNFPEFAQKKSPIPARMGRSDANANGHSITMTKPASELLQAQKAELFTIAAYERECLHLAASRLADEIGSETMEKLRVFVDVTDLYGQLYVARDLTSRIDKGRG